MKTVKILAAVAAMSLVQRASAEIQTLRPYAYVEAQGANRVDTGYSQKPLSRFFVDYQLTKATTYKQGIFGNITDDNIKSALYIPDYSYNRVHWYYRDESGNMYWTNCRDEKRRIVTVSNPTSVGGTAVIDLYDRSSPKTMTYTWAHEKASENTISLFALSADGSYKEGVKRIYCFEAADETASVMPTVLFVPATNALGAAGFTNVVAGTFHGEAMSDVADGKALVYSDGVGSAADYKYENAAVYARFHAYANDTEKGAVAFGEGPASGTAEAWVKRGESVTLTAVPTDGQEFRGWTGDTWAITSGTTADAVVTVKSGTAVQLLAHYGDRSWRWTGAADDGNWFTPGNWIDPSGSAATALRSGDSFTFVSPVDQTVAYNPSETDASFGLGTVTFGPVCGKVTVTGAEIASLTNIVCENGEENILSCAVVFAGAIDVAPTDGYVRFSGGATGINIVNHTTYYGKYTVTAAGDWNPPNGSVLTSDSQLDLPDGTYYDHIARMTIEKGAAVTVQRTKTDGYGIKKLLSSNKGVFRATNEIFSGTRLNDSGGGGGYLEETTGGGVFMTKKLRMTGVLIPPYRPAKTIIGADGIVHGKNGYVRIGNTGVHYFGSSADWQLYYNSHDNSSTVYKGIRKIGNDGETVVTFDTTDYYDDTVGRTITAESGIGGMDSGLADTVKVVILGKGRFVFANTGVNDNDFGGGLTASNAVTVSVRIGARPGKGTVTLADTSTLEVAASGTVTLGGALTLGEDASLAFRFTDRAVAPCLAMATGSTLPDTVNVKLSAEEGLPFKTGTFSLTSGGAFAGKTVNLVDRPKWVRSVKVDAEGDLTVETTAGGFTLFVR